MKNFVIIMCMVVAFTKVYAQTTEQKAVITANYDKDKLSKIVQNFEKENELRLARIQSYLGHLTKEELLEIDIISLTDIDPEGIPLFMKSHNNGAASTIKVDKLRSGGSLGLDLTGDSMIAGIWEAQGGYPLNSHVDLTGRITAIDGGGGDSFHATHVAGTIMSSGSSTFFGIGKGIAYEASLVAGDSENDLSEMATQAGSGLLVSNHSYGLGAESLPLWYFGAYNSRASATDVITANFPYYVPVISAGNDRNANPSINATKGGYDLLTGPSNAKNSITSAAVESVSNYTSPFSVVMSTFSNYGPTDDGRIKPDISSKGVDVNSTSNASNTSYANSSGTSMSAPSITGLIVLLQEHYNNVNSNFMLAATAKGLLLHTADEAGVADGPDYRFGWGLANGEKAAQAITNSETTSLVEEASLSNSAERVFGVKATGGEPLMISISWTDPAAFPIEGSEDDRSVRLINDLDIVLSKGGVDYFPWKLDPINASSGATRNSTNDVDNFEKVEIDSPIADDVYEVTINHKGSLSGGSQNYSLIITGGVLNDLSINDNILSNSLVVYPNPSKGEFTISFDSNVSNSKNVSIDIYDISGRLVYKNNFVNESFKFNKSINLSGVASGIYVATISNGTNIATQKIIIE